MRSAVESPIIRFSCAAQILDDGFVHLVAGFAQRARPDQAAERQHGDFRGAAADIDHHAAGRIVDLQTRAERGGHRLFDQLHAARAGGLRAFQNGAALNRRRARRHADDDLRDDQSRARQHLADELLDHLLGDVEIGDDAVAQRADDFHVAVGLAEHGLGFGANRVDHLAAAFVDVRDDRRLIENDAAALDVDERVRGPQIDRQIRRNETEHIAEHAVDNPRRSEKPTESARLRA